MRRALFILALLFCLFTPDENVKAQSFEMKLVAGWNLFSVPLQPADSAVSRVLESISGKYSSVYSFVDGAYKTYKPDQSENDLTQITAGMGYWVYMDQEGTLSINGSSAPLEVKLKPDWNLVGFNSTSPLPIREAFSSINGKFSAVYSYRSDKNNFDSWFPPSEDNLKTLEPGSGYWVLATEAATWTLPHKTPNPGPIKENITVALIGQSILHQPGSAGTGSTGKNVFYYLEQWGNKHIEEFHYTISGAGLQEHFRNSRTTSLINKGYDYFLMCEGTKYYWTRKRTESDAADLGGRARKAGSIPVIYIPYAHNGRSSEPYFSTEEVMKAYMGVAAKLQMPFIPVAHAIGEAVKAFGASKIYNDEVHLNSDGQFLAGCVTAATLLQTPPASINYKGDTAGLKLDRTKMLEICRQTIEKYHPDSRLLTPKK
jgi:hypothetical protein